jgi:hypothetical protein
MSSNKMTVNGLDVRGTKTLSINLADDYLEVRGFGKPVTKKKAQLMAERLFAENDIVWKFILTLEKNPAFKELAKDKAFQLLKQMIDPSKQIVSGVFGKEIILQILAQKNCEGIRYIYAKDDAGRQTIILTGVEEIEGKFIKNKDGITIAKSSVLTAKKIKAAQPKKAALAVAAKSTGDGGDSGDDPINGEVHDDGLTVEETRKLLSTL